MNHRISLFAAIVLFSFSPLAFTSPALLREAAFRKKWYPVEEILRRNPGIDVDWGPNASGHTARWYIVRFRPALLEHIVPTPVGPIVHQESSNGQRRALRRASSLMLNAPITMREVASAQEEPVIDDFSEPDNSVPAQDDVSAMGFIRGFIAGLLCRSCC